ncbi:MAG: hypothetical protein K2Q12_02315 [Rickettsiales bacterium]|jgi:hypothetical protein|nr:hypothetical protein [Rickettsiales bacterium]
MSWSERWATIRERATGLISSAVEAVGSLRPKGPAGAAVDVGNAAVAISGHVENNRPSAAIGAGAGAAASVACHGAVGAFAAGVGSAVSGVATPVGGVVAGAAVWHVGSDQCRQVSGVIAGIVEGGLVLAGMRSMEVTDHAPDQPFRSGTDNIARMQTTSQSMNV